MGDYIKIDEVIAEVETDKVNVEIKAEGSGVITNIFAKEKEKLDVLADFIEYDTDGKPAGGQAKAPEIKHEEPKKVEKTVEATKPEPQPSTPSKPTESKKEEPKAKAPQTTTQSVGVVGGSRNIRKEPMNRMRQRIGERLKGSQNTYATLTTFNECDMSEVMALRNKFQEEFSKKYGVKLGFMSFFLRAATMALTEMPIVNAVIEGEDIVYRDYIDISVAVATPNGLMVPVIRNCETKSLSDFELTLRDLSNSARDNKIKIEDMAGGNFTISNGGVYGSMLGTPIINPPQSAILGMHNIVNRPVVRGEEIVARPIMYLALSYDHRLLDGREGVLFVKRIKDLIEEPKRIIVNL